MGGSVNMVEETLKLAYGENSEFIKDKRIAAVQSLSGTGACRLFADFQKRFVLIPRSTYRSRHGPSSCSLRCYYYGDGLE
jgi:aspartate aminotransferase